MDMVEETQIGRFAVQVELANNGDLARARAGHIGQDRVRHLQMRGVVNTNVMRLVIPESVAKQLGVPLSGSAQVRFADGRTANRDIAKDVHLTYQGRDGVFSAIVEPGRESALIGAIVLEDLDFVVDCSNQRLVPRDPNQIISEIE